MLRKFISARYKELTIILIKELIVIPRTLTRAYLFRVSTFFAPLGKLRWATIIIQRQRDVPTMDNKCVGVSRKWREGRICEKRIRTLVSLWRSIIYGGAMNSFFSFPRYRGCYFFYAQSGCVSCRRLSHSRNLRANLVISLFDDNNFLPSCVLPLFHNIFRLCPCVAIAIRAVRECEFYMNFSGRHRCAWIARWVSFCISRSFQSQFSSWIMCLGGHDWSAILLFPSYCLLFIPYHLIHVLVVFSEASWDIYLKNFL